MKHIHYLQQNSQKSEEHWSQPQTSRPRLAKRLMHMVHLSGNTSVLSKSSVDWLNYTGFPGDVCVALFNIPPGNKDAVTPNPLTKEESCRVYKCDVERFIRVN